jgi:hypothetical protein
LYSIEVVPRPQGGAGSEGQFEGRVLDLSACAKISECVQEAQRTLTEELTAAFQQPPLSASPVTKRVLPPSQVRFQRITEESTVLRGMAGPYFEMSTYTATFWLARDGFFAGSAELYFSRQSDPKMRSAAADQIFLQVEQALQISVGRKGSYEEPTRDQYAAYERAVTDAVQTAIARATARLGGKVGADRVGVIPATKVTR